MQRELKYVYESLYIRDVVRNPLSPVDFKQGQMITSEVFIKDIDKFFLENFPV